MKYCYKNTSDLNAFLSWLLMHGGVIKRPLQTDVGLIYCKVYYNELFNEFMLSVDGSMCSTYKQLDYILSELNGLF